MFTVLDDLHFLFLVVFIGLSNAINLENARNSRHFLRMKIQSHNTVYVANRIQLFGKGG